MALQVSGVTVIDNTRQLSNITGLDATTITTINNSISVGGATGGGTDEIFIENGQIVTQDYTIPATKNAMSTGPVEINSGVTVTVSTGARWVVI